MAEMQAVRYVTVDELVYINEQLIQDRNIHTIVEGKRAVRDMDLLEAAVGRPQQSAFGEDAYPTLALKAAAMLHSIARNHPFADGNKRTSTVGIIFMLQINGRDVAWDAADALGRIVDIAEGHTSVEDFADWLQTKPHTPSPSPDAGVDMPIIAAILRDHHWLLTELALR